MESRTTRRPSRPAAGHVRLVLLVLGLLAGAACEMRTDVNVSVEADGSGQVELVVALDEEAMDRDPGLLADLDLGDLRATDWAVEGPTEDDDGWTTIAVRHAFGSPEEVAGLISEVAGRDGPFRDFALEREDAFAETRYRFEGSVDLASGIDGLTEDPELAEALGADPAALVEQEVGAPLREVLTLRVAVRLPGEVESNAPVQGPDRAVWQPSGRDGGPDELTASSTLRRSDRILWLVVAAVAGAAAVLLVAIRIVRWKRSEPPPGS